MNHQPLIFPVWLARSRIRSKTRLRRWRRVQGEKVLRSRVAAERAYGIGVLFITAQTRKHVILILSQSCRLVMPLQIEKFGRDWQIVHAASQLRERNHNPRCSVRSPNIHL
jgi:hypothetical protein